MEDRGSCRLLRKLPSSKCQSSIIVRITHWYPSGDQIAKNLKVTSSGAVAGVFSIYSCI